MINSKYNFRKDNKMKRTNKLLNIFLLASLALTLLATTFASLSVCLTYKESISNIKISSPFSIFFIIFIVSALALPIAQAIIIKDYKITRAKDTIFLKIAAIITIVALAVLSLYDFISAVSGISTNPPIFETWRFIRIFAAVPFIASLVFTAFKKQIKVNNYIRYVVSLFSTAWILFSLLAIYFHKGSPPIPEYFRIMLSFNYIFGALFFLYDFKWNDFASSTRVYIALTTLFTTFSFVFATAGLIGNIRMFSEATTSISIYEIGVCLAFGVFGLAKLTSIKQAVCITTKQEKAKEELKNNQVKKG